MLTGIVAVVSIVGLAVLVLWIRDRFANASHARRNPQEKRAAERKAYEHRILHPDWEFFERHLGRPIPAAIKELYADRELVTSGITYGDDDFISTFMPLDANAPLDTRDYVGFDIVPIATSICGDPIYLRPGASQPDTVYVTYHDGGDTEVFAESVEAMLAIIRRGVSR
jgi:hypothetical protein